MRNSIHCMLLTATLSMAVVTPAAAQKAGTSVRIGQGGGSTAAGWTEGGRGYVHSRSGRHFATSSAFDSLPDGGYSYSSHDAIRLADGSILGFGHQMHSGPDGEGYGTTEVRIHGGGRLEMSGQAGPGLIDSFGGGTGGHVVTNFRTNYRHRRRSPVPPYGSRTSGYWPDARGETGYGPAGHEYYDDYDVYGVPASHGVRRTEFIGPDVYRAGQSW